MHEPILSTQPTRPVPYHKHLPQSHRNKLITLPRKFAPVPPLTISFSHIIMLFLSRTTHSCAKSRSCSYISSSHFSLSSLLMLLPSHLSSLPSPNSPVPPNVPICCVNDANRFLVATIRLLEPSEINAIKQAEDTPTMNLSGESKP